MKITLIILSLIATSFSFGQTMGGLLVDEGRKMLTKTNYIVEGTQNGWAIYELAVDRKGNVASARMVDTNLKSTPTKMIIREHLVKYKFAPGTYYPKHHHVRIKITSVKPAPKEEPLGE